MDAVALRFVEILPVSLANSRGVFLLRFRLLFVRRRRLPAKKPDEGEERARDPDRGYERD